MKRGFTLLLIVFIILISAGCESSQDSGGNDSNSIPVIKVEEYWVESYPAYDYDGPLGYGSCYYVYAEISASQEVEVSIDVNVSSIPGFNCDSKNPFFQSLTGNRLSNSMTLKKGTYVYSGYSTFSSSSIKVEIR